MQLTFLQILLLILNTGVFYLTLRFATGSRKGALLVFIPTVVISFATFLFFPVKSSALEMGVTYENLDAPSSMVDDTFSYYDSIYGASEVVPQEGGERYNNADHADDIYPVFRPNSNAVLNNLGDDDVSEPFSFSVGTDDVDSGFSATTVSEDIHALREYSEFFLFGFVPITIAVIVLALGCNWFYKTFISSTFL